MVKNVGVVDRSLRFILGLALVLIGLFTFDGIDGNILGIVIAVCSLLPFYMVFTGSCFVFKWFKIHTLSKSEEAKNGHPYTKD